MFALYPLANKTLQATVARETFFTSSFCRAAVLAVSPPQRQVKFNFVYIAQNHNLPQGTTICTTLTRHSTPSNLQVRKNSPPKIPFNRETMEETSVL